MIRNKYPLKIDSDSPILALRSLHKLKRDFPEELILGRKSSSGRGYHFMMPNVILGARANIKLRELYGDCKGRLKNDKIRMKGGMRINVLFEYKNGKKCPDWKEIEMMDILKDLCILSVSV